MKLSHFAAVAALLSAALLPGARAPGSAADDQP